MEREEEIQWLVTLARISLESARQSGFEVKEVEILAAQAETLLEQGKPDQALAQACRLRKALREPLSHDPLWSYDEPSDLENILTCLPPPSPLSTYNLADYSRDALGGWIGQIIGSALGLEVENWSAERIREEIGEINDYIRKPPETRNDDTSFQIIALHALESHGSEFRPWELGLEWIEHMPVGLTAEGVALTNLMCGLQPPETARQDNPFNEWVGGAMKAPIWGLLTPGRPDLAIRYAFRDASIAHQANGIYGAFYTAALVSLAFIEHDLDQLLKLACQYIPQKSRLAQLVSRSFEWFQACATWDQALERYHSEYELYHRAPYAYVHILPCLTAALIGFHYGQGDFERSICIATMCGGDTDFPPALVGTILGIWRGEAGIPAKWRLPIGPEFETMAIGMERLSYTGVVERICKQGRSILESAE